MEPISNYKSIDSLFNESAFCEKVSNLYYKYKICFSDNKLEEIEPYFTQECFEGILQRKAQLKASGRYYYAQRVTVLGTVIDGYTQTAEQDIIFANLNVRAVEYEVDLNKNIVFGTQNEQFLNGKVELVRTKGSKTLPKVSGSARNCPNCGAPLNLSKSARCEYCDSVLSNDPFNWKFNLIF